MKFNLGFVLLNCSILTFSPKIHSIKEQKSFKKRGPLLKKVYKLRYGSVGLFFAQEGLMKTSYFRRIARIIKLKFKRRSKKFKGLHRRIWFFLQLNFPLTMKSTNSRMGKGKGGFTSWAIRVKTGQPMVEFKGFSFDFVLGLKSMFFKKLKLRLNVIKKNKFKNFKKLSETNIFLWHI